MRKERIEKRSWRLISCADHHSVNTLWALLCRLCEEGFAAQQLELLEIVTGNMWTLLRNIPSIDNCPVVMFDNVFYNSALTIFIVIPQAVTPGLMEGILHLAKNGSVEVRTNTIGMLAFLGRLPHEPVVVKVLFPRAGTFFHWTTD